MKVSIILFILASSIAASKITVEADALRENALEVLQRKCNVCHQGKNPQKVFTIENMDDLAREINRQVFVFKRMPKKNGNKLTDKEKEQLKNWINHIKLKS